MTNAKKIPRVTTETLEKILLILKQEIKQWRVPAVGQLVDEGLSYDQPKRIPYGPERAYQVLISTILSLRTKDAVTEPASLRLLKEAPTPERMLLLTVSQIEKLIYPVGFYKTKAKNLIKVCELLLSQFNREVPRTMEALLSLPGVGRKTANLVLTIGYDLAGICVDTHVHRICNIWGYVNTKSPDDTEFALRKKLPPAEWKIFNDILVTFGQNLCVPVSPWCSRCQIVLSCPRIGVTRSR